MDDSIETNIARRNVLKTGALAATATAVPLGAIAQTPNAGNAATPAVPASAPVTSKVTLRVNGKAHELTVDTRTSLLDVLRENLHLTGTKKGCDQGQCGACTIIVDGRRINSCLSLAIMHDGYQCGYCTPGQICSAVSVLDEIRQGVPSHVTADLNQKPLLSIDEIRERMSGNICRCGAYSNIVDAITEVAGGKA